MRRRDLLTLAGAALLAAPFAAWAQQTSPPRKPSGGPWLIGAVISLTATQSDIDSLGPFRKGMADLGYAGGKDYVIEARYANGDANKYDAAVQQVVSLMPDVIVTDVPQNVAPLTKSISIAAYIGGSGYQAVVDALVGSLARPKGNVTGLSASAVAAIAKDAQLLVEIIPAVMRLGVLISVQNPDGGQADRDAVLAVAKAGRFAPVFVDVSTPADLPAAFRALADQRVEGIVVGSGNLFAADRTRTVSLANELGLPTTYNQSGYVEAGGLASYGFDRKATFTRLASTVDLILKNTNVADIPMETADLSLAVNLKTAKSLGLTIPQTVLFRADELIQ